MQMKAIEQYFHVVLFIMLYKVVQTFKSVDETLVCDHSTENYWAVLSNFYVCMWNLCLKQYFHVVLFIMLNKVLLTLRLWLKP